MTIKNEQVSSFTDLITKLDTYLATVGWTSERLDTSTAVTTGGEWAMRHTASTNIRFAASWDGAGTPNEMAIYQYVDQAYVVGDRPWGQDHDSGNGDSDTTTPEDGRHVILGTSPIQYWAFTPDDAKQYAHIVVEYEAGKFSHFGFGILEKKGDWTGGEYAYGQRNNLSATNNPNRPGASYLIDGRCEDNGDTGGPVNGMELFAATIHCEGLPSQVANGMWAVSVGGDLGGHQTDFGNDRQSNDGSSSDTGRVMFIDGYRHGPWMIATARSSQASGLEGIMNMWPIAPRYVTESDGSGDVYGPMGFMPDVFGCNIAAAIAPGTILTDDAGDSYSIFPANEHGTSGTSGNFGVAYKSSTYADPGMPSSVSANVTGWFSSRLAADYTLDGGGEVTQLDDKSGNGADCTQLASAGPTITDVGGRNWMTFGSTAGASGDRLGCSFSDSAAMDPDGGDFSCVVVFRNSSGNDVSPFFKAGGTGGGADPDAHYGMRFNRVTGDDIEYRMRDVTFANQLSLTDNLTTYSDGSSQIVGLTYDDSIADALMFGDDNDPATAVASDLTWASAAITPGGTFNIGAWETTNPFEGEIAELIFFDTVLSGSQRTDVWDYLKTKWDIV